MKHLPLFVIAFITLGSCLRADEELNRKGVEEIVAKAAGQPREQRIESLGLALMRLSSASIFPDREKIRGLQEEVRKQLVSIPGHADHFHHKLRKHEAQLLVGKGSLSAFDSDRLPAFEILQLSQSPEAVGVLASFLDDDLGSPEHRFPKQPPDEDTSFGSTAYLAVRALGAMGLENAVTNSQLETTDFEGGVEKRSSREFIKMDVDRPKWKQWWARVVAGKATIRFKGSDGEYGASLPVPVSTEAATDLANKAFDEVVKGGLDGHTGASSAHSRRLPLSVPGFCVKDEPVWLIPIQRSVPGETRMPAAAWVNKASGKMLFFHGPWLEQDDLSGLPVPAGATTEEDAKQRVSKLNQENLKPAEGFEPGPATAKLVRLPFSVDGFHAKGEPVWLVEIPFLPPPNPVGRERTSLPVVAWVSRTSSQVAVCCAPWFPVGPPEAMEQPR